MDEAQRKLAVRYAAALAGTDRTTILSPVDVAKITGVTHAAVLVWIRKGYLPAVKRNKYRWQLKATDVERFIKARLAGVVPRRAFVEAPAEARAAVERLGFTVIQAANMTDALLKLASSRPQLFVLDAGSARIPALTLLEQAKSRKLSRGVWVLLIGAIAEAEISRAVSLGVNGIVTSAADLAAELERLVERG